MSPDPNPSVAGIRIDLWLWAARFFKTRALAKDAIEHGKVSIGGQLAKKASRAVRIGDRLDIERAGEVYRIEVLALSAQRGPAAQAQTLYSEPAESINERMTQRELRRAQNAGFSPPEHRPDKRGRRKLSQLRQQEDGLPPWFPR